VRIATWNLARGGRTAVARRAQLEIVRHLDVDVMVVTEPPNELLEGPGVVSSPQERPGRSGPESWVVLLGDGLEPVGEQLPYERMATAARFRADGIDVIAYGSVLPWRAAPHQAPDLAQPGESASTMFERVLAAQEADIRALQERHPQAVVIWAGDFNQSLAGPNLTGSRRGRVALLAALGRLGMQAWNAESPHARSGLSTIDLVCGPATVPVKSIELLEPSLGGQSLSDHAGYIVEVSLG